MLPTRLLCLCCCAGMLPKVQVSMFSGLSMNLLLLSWLTTSARTVHLGEGSALLLHANIYEQ